MEFITTLNAPQPNGHYSQAIAHGGFLFVSTQLPVDPVMGHAASQSVSAQALLVFRNILAIVEAGGSQLDHIVRMTIYVSDIAFWPEVNSVYESFFGDARPARGVIPCGKLHLGCDVAADCIAGIVNEVPPVLAPAKLK